MTMYEMTWTQPCNRQYAIAVSRWAKSCFGWKVSLWAWWIFCQTMYFIQWKSFTNQIQWLATTNSKHQNHHQQQKFAFLIDSNILLVWLYFSFLHFAWNIVPYRICVSLFVLPKHSLFTTSATCIFYYRSTFDSELPFLNRVCVHEAVAPPRVLHGKNRNSLEFSMLMDPRQ